MIGKTISHYKILSKLGEGGMGVVYKAEDTKLKRIVALKFLPPELTRDPEAKKRFVQEAQAASSLDHANICTVHEINETEDGQLFISIACYEGETLKERIAKGPLSAREALDIVQQMARGLAKAHANGIVHRDIKPSNIFLTKDNEIKIVDFGVAKLTGDTRLTRTGASPGTLFYMSPEQARGEEVDHRTDIWALGVVLYEMLTGGLPFKGDHDAAVLYSVLNEEPAPVTIEGVGGLKDMGQIISKALAKDPSKRYQSIAEMRADLEAAKAGLGGPQKRSINQDRVQQRSRKNLFLIGIPVVLVAVVVIVLAVWLGKRPSGVGGPVTETSSAPGATAVKGNSIAVLPLANLAPGNENEFFVDGMTEELISQLAHIRALKVISRTSVMRFKNTEEPLTEIARQLGVTMILEGSVLWAGDEVRISVQLLDGVNDRHMWAKSYDSEFADILGLQRRVAKDVAGQIRVELTEKEKDRLATSPAPNEKAYELYLRGRFFWDRRSVQALNKAMEYYQQAVDLDPDYALAYAGLAESRLLLATYRAGLRPDQIYPEARKMALRALELDPELAEAHVALGAIAHEYEWDWEKSERHFLRAIELNPNYATAHQWYGELLSTLWRMDESISEMRKAQELDPLSLVVNALVALVLVQSGDGAAGLAELDRVLELDPSFPAAYMVGNACYYWVGEAEKSIESYLRWVELDAATERQKEEARLLRQAYEAGGAEAFYRTAIAQLIRMYEESYVRPTWIMRFFCALGEPDSAMVWLERGYDEHTLLGFGITLPHVEVLYDDPRFTDLLKRMRLARWWEEAGII